MAIRQEALLQEAARVTRSATASARPGQTTAFLCHSHRDERLALGLQQYLCRSGWDLYIDWQDSSMPERPNQITAQRIRRKIGECDWFLFLATANSMASRWCPWELGYADGKKPLERLAIVPTSAGGSTHGNEYLDLYRTIDQAGTQVALFEAGAQRGRPVSQI